MEYKIFERDSQEHLITEVNKQLKKGWELQGGVCVFRHVCDEHEWYGQAMRKEDEKPDVNICPGCGGESGGNDRSVPPNPYYCDACAKRPAEDFYKDK